MPMLSAFRFLLTLVLISASLRAQASRPYCEVKVGKNVVKVFLEADEAVGEGFISEPVLSEVDIYGPKSPHFGDKGLIAVFTRLEN